MLERKAGRQSKILATADCRLPICERLREVTQSVTKKRGHPGGLPIGDCQLPIAMVRNLDDSSTLESRESRGGANAPVPYRASFDCRLSIAKCRLNTSPKSGAGFPSRKAISLRGKARR